MKELLIENLGVIVAGLATGFGGWFYGRKKADAEAEASQIENAEKLLSFYKNMVDDLGQRLENSILRFNAAENTIKQLEDRINDLTEELKKYKQLNGKIH